MGRTKAREAILGMVGSSVDTRTQGRVILTDDICVFRCTACGKKMTRNFTMNPWDKINVNNDGSYTSICGMTGNVEKCEPINKSQPARPVL